MAKLHNIGPRHFVQFLHFPAQWEGKLWVTGWTQEIQHPYRRAEPLILRLPFKKAFVVGKWQDAEYDEEEALMYAVQYREATYDDFTEEAGWTPAPDEADEEGRKDINT